MAQGDQAEVAERDDLRELAGLGIVGRLVRKWRQGDLAGAAWRVGVRKARQLAGRARASDLHYRLDFERVLTKRYADTFAGLSSHHVAYGNYYLDSRHPLRADSVIYSFGVGGDVSFDLAVAEASGAEVHLYDPTPSSIAFMEMLRLRRPDDPVVKRLRFFPVGAWSEDTVLQFVIPAKGGSATAVGEVRSSSGTFDAPCQAVTTMMATNRHTHIDVLKMDIEGAAEVVMESLLAAKIFPTQVVVEFERPRRDVKKVIEYFAHVERICERLRAEGYEIALLPRSRAKYFGLELLFSRRP
jgi:FkbM family methyltransferase